MSQQSHRKDNFPYWLPFKKKKVENTTHPYGPEWKRLSTRLKNAAGNACTWCHAERSIRPYVTLAVHHLDHNPYNNNPLNLCVLCNSCHRYVHSQALQHNDLYLNIHQGQLFFLYPPPPNNPTKEVNHENT